MGAPLREAARLLYELRGLSEDLFQEATGAMSTEDLRSIVGCWQLYARPSQLRPEKCRSIWLRMAGRGEGKTRSAAEETLDISENWGSAYRGILISKTIGDVRDVMIEGESGLEACAARRGYEVRYIANKAIVRFPGGGVAHVLSSETPQKPRGYQSNHVWGDEIAAWMNAVKTLDNTLLGWRLPVPIKGGRPLMTLTTTPAPNPVMFRLTQHKALSKRVTVTHGKTLDNAANLDADSLAMYMAIYEGTRLGRQELDGELLARLGAVIDQDVIHMFRVRKAPELSRRIVSLDPSITAKEDSDAAGIVVIGSDNQRPADAYLLADRTIESATFGMWAEASVRAFLDFNCDCVVAEVNQGGGGIAEAIKTAADAMGAKLGREIVVPVRSIWARESKQARAEPVGALYERGRIHHVGVFKDVEQEITTWMPGMDSPNRLDAIVHGVTHLLLGDERIGPIGAYF